MFKYLPPLKSLLAFAAASRRKNFSLAAQDLYITQSAISHQIKNLEQFVGHKLFFRQGNQLQLTDEGSTLAGVVNPALDQIVSVSKLLTGNQDHALQFGVSSAFAVHRLTRALSDLNHRHPQLDLRLRMLTCDDHLAALDLDIIVTDLPFNHVAYECELLKIERYFPVANAALAQQLRSLPTTAWPTMTRLIDIQGVESWKYWFGDLKSEIPTFNELLFGHTLLMLQATLSGQGIGLLGESLIVNELMAGTLVKLTDQPFSFGDDGFYFCWHKRRKADGNVRLVRQWLQGLLA